MKCPECIKEEKKSCVYEQGATTTLMNVVSYYDEDGKHIYNNPNKTTISYSCSNGHKWHEVL